MLFLDPPAHTRIRNLASAAFAPQRVAHLRNHIRDVAMYDRVVTINKTHWPAYRKPGATLVDLRMFDPNDRSSQPRLVFRPEKLRELGIPDALIEAAAKSDPQGFLLFDDLPDQTQPATGLANQTTIDESAT